MSLTVSKAALSGVLARVLPVTQKTTSLPTLNCVLLTVDDNKLRACGTNLDCFIEAYCECRGNNGATMKPTPVPATLLSKIVQAAGDNITFTVDKRLKVQSSGGDAELAYRDAAEFAPWPEAKLTAVGVNCGDLANAIDAVRWAAASPRDGFALLEHVHLELSAKEIRAAATDRKHIAEYCLPAIAAKADVLVPQCVAGLIAEFLRLPEATLKVGETHIAVESASASIIARVFDGQFPNMRRVIDAEWTPLGDINRKELLTALRTCLALSDALDYDHVRISLAADGVKVERNCAIGRYATTTGGKLKAGRAWTFGGARLVDCLTAFDEDTVTVSACGGDKTTPVRMQSGNLTVILAPINL